MYDTSPLYGDSAFTRSENWLIVDSCYLHSRPEFDNLYANNKDYLIEYIHLEAGKVGMKIFYSREWNDLDLYGNPYYKKVA